MASREIFMAAAARMAVPASRFSTRKISRLHPASDHGGMERIEDGGTSSTHEQSLAGAWSSTILLAIGALVAITVAEVITAYVNPLYGVIAHSVLLLLLLSLSVLLPERPGQTLALALTIAPIIRILSLGIPLAHMPQPFWYLLTGIPLFVSGYLVIKETGIPRGLLGLELPARRYLPEEIAVILSGVGLGVMEWEILRPAPMVGGGSLGVIVAAAVILFVFTGILEEFLFRGIIQAITANVLGVNPGWIFTAALFAILHVGWHSVLDIFFVLGVGLYFGFVVRCTRSLFGVSVAHGLINIMLFLVLPLTA